VRPGSASLCTVKRAAPLSSIVVALTACATTGAREGGPPPPRGKTMEEYLQEAPPPAKAPPEGMVAADSMKLHAIDVGQGTALLLEFPCAAVLVDTGGEQNEQFDSVPALIGYLDDFFARRTDLKKTISLLVISHPHIDHTRGIEAVLGRYPVKNVVDNGDVRDDVGGKPQLALHAWLSKRRKKVGHLDVARSEIDPEDGITGAVVDPVGGCAASKIDPVLRALWSGDTGREEIGQNPNNDSVVLRVDFGEASLLLPGDLELLAIARLVKKYEKHPELIDADVYLVPHHGSRNSSTADFVRRVSPEVAIISNGPYDRYLQTEEEYTARVFGHPNQVSIDHLLVKGGVSGRRASPIEAWVGVRGAWKEKKSEFAKRTIDRAIYSTGWDGTVVVTANANGWLEVTTSRPSAAQATK
jgi:competence protein ComEC